MCLPRMLSAVVACRSLLGESTTEVQIRNHPNAALHQHPLTRDLVLRYGWNAMAYQILNPGIHRWYSADQNAVVGYVSSGGYRVVAGAPICAAETMADVAAAFEAHAARHGEQVCYFGAQDRMIHLLKQRGPIATLLLGAQPTWHPATLAATFQGKSSLRAQCARARNKGVRIERWDQKAQSHPALRRCLAEWLTTRGLPPMHFLVEPQTLDVLDDRRVWVALREQQVVGFLLASPVPLRNGWLVEQMIRGYAAPNGTVELLLQTAAEHMADDGANFLTLGLSPLSVRAGFPQSRQTPLVLVALAWVRAHGRRFYNFDGLDTFKAKFLPEEWEPIYAVAEGTTFPLWGLYAIAGAFGGTAPWRFVGAGVWRAARQEWRWARAFRPK